MNTTKEQTQTEKDFFNCFKKQTENTIKKDKDNKPYLEEFNFMVTLNRKEIVTLLWNWSKNNRAKKEELYKILCSQLWNSWFNGYVQLKRD